MRLTSGQLNAYQERGFVVLRALFDADEVESLRTAFARDARAPGPHRVRENGTDELRAVYASHQRQPEFASLIRSPRLLGPARQLVSPDVYMYQFKINSKPAFSGGGWAWHQDFIAWRAADDLPKPRLLNVALFLDDATEHNGPVIFLPGSHRRGATGVRCRGDAALSGEHVDPDEIALGREEMRELVVRHGMESAKGPAGSVVFFHPEIVHGSATNMSPLPRRLLIATYNDVRNQPRPTRRVRPDYLVGRDTRTLQFNDEPRTLADGDLIR
ncbi:phytanoyl-CoA dioxygenase family protein [Streptomyces olivaceus]|uniref:Phytanoyl-CoA dioxygenase family protein n=1 Tax=Streptomyces olivaceus TaxID=47716 RepID=A0ABS7WFA2_STROV|nr:phytanoyl-CoA dioxygenase family protein [Streptomyces olivaceus]MBZ6093486.1 phytanoyl-CoA dioxygenase family protein [Streptomyces olivaceus]MBZ6100419.1 phytanoyl-CoA dioxygenase family protein [Streptomyces olivaceus]MBZ6121583.1 phytanoyl-CoA dioxygenase family protein [Streptomyces olivaceus]MBZ6156319.1 phytanoyl-CoA dioxygenase family protein [Streptomyces olivaceus]MBZ6302845.1 phytanoyl-CoA dioxygenase family protein [Streptomyces olivaceus]